MQSILCKSSETIKRLPMQYAAKYLIIYKIDLNYIFYSMRKNSFCQQIFCIDYWTCIIQCTADWLFAKNGYYLRIKYAPEWIGSKETLILIKNKLNSCLRMDENKQEQTRIQMFMKYLLGKR